MNDPLLTLPPGLHALLDPESRPAAKHIVPKLLEIFEPRSVLDAGCGAGSWLAEFSKLGIDDYLGIDVPSIDRSLLKIPEGRFRGVDLREGFDLGRRFDLALCLEVASYLKPERAGKIVDALVRHADIVIFSAAIPFQDSFQSNHQWPAYWAGLFAQRGFAAIDMLRPQFWENPAIPYYFSQNIIVYVKGSRLASDPRLAALAAAHPGAPLPLVHYLHYLRWIQGEESWSEPRCECESERGIRPVSAAPAPMWLPILGYVEQTRMPSGISSDGWTAGEFRFSVLMKRAARSVTLRGYLPDYAAQTMSVEVRVGDAPGTEYRAAPGRPFEWTLEGPLIEGQLVSIAGRCSETYNVQALGLGDDPRDLGVLLTDILFDHTQAGK